MSKKNVTIPSMTDKLLVRLSPELKQLIGEEADRLGIDGGMGELAVKILSQHFRRPDLAKIPRKKMGRPRIKQPI